MIGEDCKLKSVLTENWDVLTGSSAATLFIPFGSLDPCRKSNQLGR